MRKLFAYSNIAHKKRALVLALALALVFTAAFIAANHSATLANPGLHWCGICGTETADNAPGHTVVRTIQE
ncbi:MAG: hypothetical protein FWH26_05570, partial [Oscillospiraceae bacterium]|nr:hypothetical protein [Oscillospiraceae bacterium]